MTNKLENKLISRIRRGEDDAWRHVIDTYEGRLTAFAHSRLRNAALAEEVVQEAFVGFLTSLPNYDEERTSLESFLFRITAHKITDTLRRKGRRPEILLSPEGAPLSGKARKASSMARSREGGVHRRQLLENLLREMIAEWKVSGNYERLKCCELLFVRGIANKEVASQLNLSEQQVANHKQFVVQRLKAKNAAE